ncbi:MAG: hypothetical protein IT384_00770 [Deltaproteobacteria bacterium]|nr:hypothetical protein [Deltaproteobacteria bacterium]
MSPVETASSSPPSEAQLKKRLLQVAEECELLSDVLHAVRTLTGQDPPFVELDEVSGRLRTTIEQLATLSWRTPGFAREISGVEASLQRIEGMIRAIDDALEMPRVKERAESTAILIDQQQRYLMFVARGLAEVPARSDRLEYLVTRLIADQSGPRRALRPRAHVSSLLGAIAGDTRADPVTRQATLAVLDAAERRLDQITSIEGFFTSNLYFEIRRQKQIIGPQLIDPDILYAIAQLNVAVGNRLADLLEAESRAQEAAPEPQRAVLGALTIKATERFEETRRAVRASLAPRNEPTRSEEAPRSGAEPRASRPPILVVGGVIVATAAILAVVAWIVLSG